MRIRFSLPAIVVNKYPWLLLLGFAEASKEALRLRRSEAVLHLLLFFLLNYDNTFYTFITNFECRQFKTRYVNSL